MLKILLGVFAATIRGSSRSRVRLIADLRVPVKLRRPRPAGSEYKGFSCYGVSPARDNSFEMSPSQENEDACGSSRTRCCHRLRQIL
jgi:hypothetical protein